MILYQIFAMRSTMIGFPAHHSVLLTDTSPEFLDALNQLGEQKIILHMFQKGYTTAQIADIASLEELKIKTIIEENELATV